MAKNSPSGHHGTSLSGCTFATKARIDNRKKLLKCNTFSTCPHNMANFGLLTAEIGSEVWNIPSKFQRGFASWLRYCSDATHRRPTKLCTMFDRLLGWYTVYTLFAALAP